MKSRSEATSCNRSAVEAGVLVYRDVRNGKVDIKGWLEGTDTSAADLRMRMIVAGGNRFLSTDISQDETMISFDCEGGIPVVRTTGNAILAAGGVSGLGGSPSTTRQWSRRYCSRESAL